MLRPIVSLRWRLSVKKRLIFSHAGYKLLLRHEYLDHFLGYRKILHKSFEKAEMSEKHLQSQVLLAFFFQQLSLGQDRKPAKHSPSVRFAS